MRETKIVFFGTKIWELTSRHIEMFLRHNANIVAFVEAPIDNISTTVSKEDTYENICSVAERLNIPIYSPKSPKNEDFLETLKKIAPDVIIVCGYQFYLPQALLEIPPLGVINFHSSLLPRHCGMHPGFQTIWYGDKETGMTVHYMDSGLDTGDIIYVTKVGVESGDTVDTLYDRIWDSSEPVVKRLLDDLDNRALPRKPQNLSEYFYNYELDDEDFKLDFRQPAEILYGRVSMSPGKFYFLYNDEKYFINECSILSEPVKTRRFRLRMPYVIDDKLVFVTPRGFLQIDKVTMNGEELSPLSIVNN